MKTALVASACLAAGLLAAAPADATVLYSNGPISGVINGGVINGGLEVIDSFTLGANATLGTVSNMGLWVNPGDKAQSLSWAIFTSGGTLVGTGTSGITSTFLFNNGIADIYSATFSFHGVSLSAGNYTLAIFDTKTAFQALALWDVNNGPSTACQGVVGIGCVASIGSESFQINSAIVPEPATLSLIGAGLLGAAAMRRRTKRA